MGELLPRTPPGWGGIADADVCLLAQVLRLHPLARVIHNVVVTPPPSFPLPPPSFPLHPPSHSFFQERGVREAKRGAENVGQRCALCPPLPTRPAVFHVTSALILGRRIRDPSPCFHSALSPWTTDLKNALTSCLVLVPGNDRRALMPAPLSIDGLLADPHTAAILISGSSRTPLAARFCNPETPSDGAQAVAPLPLLLGAHHSDR
jgi:hypothetical protein